LEHRLRGRRERVDPGCDQGVDALWNRLGRRSPALDEHADVLLGVQRIAAGPVEQRVLLSGPN
jgi:hypothetical protein